mmetsp:Transcript_2002/g.6172  ORF Transcript_2002/g.6172 Transcript_2002/m.6172 type:complete len:359 (-) Transcript_2002:23-1099(-)
MGLPVLANLRMLSPVRALGSRLRLFAVRPQSTRFMASAMPQEVDAPGSAPAVPSAASALGFVGLGVMGYPMAGHMAKLPGRRCLVWNRTAAKAEKHAAEHGSVCASELSDLGTVGILVLCLPTSKEDALVAEQVAAHMAPGSIILSCTSGEPAATRQLAAELRQRHGVRLLDAPVSGGEKGAAAGSLACLLGADEEAAVGAAEPVLQAFARKIVRCGPTGAGHAVKAVNNAMNAAHLLLGAEGLLALQAAGVRPEAALEAINGSSGRSLQTEQRLPQEVLTGRFAYGFKLPLMAKDCRIAGSILRDGFPGSRLLTEAVAMVDQAAAEEHEEVDYTHLVRRLELQAGRELRAAAPAEDA